MTNARAAEIIRRRRRGYGYPLAYRIMLAVLVAALWVFNLGIPFTNIPHILNTENSGVAFQALTNGAMSALNDATKSKDTE